MISCATVRGCLVVHVDGVLTYLCYNDTTIQGMHEAFEYLDTQDGTQSIIFILCCNILNTYTYLSIHMHRDSTNAWWLHLRAEITFPSKSPIQRPFGPTKTSPFSGFHDSYRHHRLRRDKKRCVTHWKLPVCPWSVTIRVCLYFNKTPKLKMVPEKGPCQKEMSSSNNQFSGV